MKFVVSGLILMGFAAASVAIIGPCAIEGYFAGNVIQRECVDTGGCGVWPYIFQTKDRTCEYWCCYGDDCNFLGGQVYHCGPYANNGCCLSTSTGHIVGTPPSCDATFCG